MKQPQHSGAEPRFNLTAARYTCRHTNTSLAGVGGGDAQNTFHYCEVGAGRENEGKNAHTHTHFMYIDINIIHICIYGADTCDSPSSRLIEFPFALDSISIRPLLKSPDCYSSLQTHVWPELHTYIKEVNIKDPPESNVVRIIWRWVTFKSLSILKHKKYNPADLTFDWWKLKILKQVCIRTIAFKSFFDTDQTHPHTQRNVRKTDLILFSTSEMV